jgi:hypothetical protein
MNMLMNMLGESEGEKVYVLFYATLRNWMMNMLRARGWGQGGGDENVTIMLDREIDDDLQFLV